MTGWNLPPGVTGHEREIEGADEIRISGVCDKVGIAVYPKYMVDELVQDMKAMVVWPKTVGVDEVGGGWRLETTDEVRVRVRKRFHEMIASLDSNDEIVAQIPCGFDGDVDADGWNDVAAWTCPRCGAEHEQEIASDPDVDRDEGELT